MADLEKVIKGLECHRIDNNHRINCSDCPYYVDDDNHIRCVNDLHDDAISMLKEQKGTINELQNAYGYLQKQFFDAQDKLLKEHESVKPILIREGRNKNYNDYVCPRCDIALMERGDDEHDNRRIFLLQNLAQSRNESTALEYL